MIDTFPTARPTISINTAATTMPVAGLRDISVGNVALCPNDTAARTPTAMGEGL